MSYLKIEAGDIIEAPAYIQKDGKKIYGYNKNAQMMEADGYEYYLKGRYAYQIKDGQIVQKQNEVIQNTEYSKLQIRRAFRRLNKQDILDGILSSNVEFAKDWNDAQVIDLNDPMIVGLIQNNVLTQEIIDEIKAQI